MIIKIFIISESIKEEQFPEWIHKQGYDCLKFTNRNFKKICERVGFTFKYQQGGKPDFFIYNEEKYYFCEFKSNSDTLKTKQICWLNNHKKFPVALAIAGYNNNVKTIFEEDISLYDGYGLKQDTWIKNSIAFNNLLQKAIVFYYQTHTPKTMYQDCSGIWRGHYEPSLLDFLLKLNLHEIDDNVDYTILKIDFNEERLVNGRY